MGFGASTPEEVAPDATVDQLQQAAVAPITEEEAALYTRSGKACCWTDSAEYAFRLRQLEIINYAIKTLAEETWKDPQMINFQDLHTDVMRYKDVNGDEADNHDWSLVGEDSTFKPLERKFNRFREFQDYFITNAGKNKADMKHDFEDYMSVFIRIRDGLIQIMAKQCAEASASGGGRRRTQHRVRQYA
jgi:hypothetical protein